MGRRAIRSLRRANQSGWANRTAAKASAAAMRRRGHTLPTSGREPAVSRPCPKLDNHGGIVHYWSMRPQPRPDAETAPADLTTREAGQAMLRTYFRIADAWGLSTA